MKFRIYAILWPFILAVGIIACKKDNNLVENPPKEENEEEIITTLKMVFRDSLFPDSSIVIMFRDIDGDGGNPPDIFDTIKLKTSTTYLVSLLLLNEATFPIDTVSNEVLEEAKDHLFCFLTNNLNLDITKTDSDGMYPIGLESIWKTGSNAEFGTINVVLKHQPEIKNGSCDLGETDVDVIFQCKIE